MVRKVCGSRSPQSNLYRVPIKGITDKETVKLDFDDTPFKTVCYWALRTMKWFKLRGFVILKSSKKSYHVLFDRKVTWRKNVHVMNWVALESQNEKLKTYALMQGIKEDSTLRISPKGDKPSPRIVFRYGSQDNQIREFLEFRRFIKNIVKRLQNEKEREETSLTILKT